jgi:hypothetical protein
VTDLSRYDDWLAWLRAHGESDPDVRVVFIGGSAVTGGYDDHSDIDVDVLTTPGEAVSTYQRLLDAARRDFEVYSVWELPEATWPDGRQAFLNLVPDPGDLRVPTRIIDLHVSELADRHRFVDPRRHGEPLVLHDPEGWSSCGPTTRRRWSANDARPSPRRRPGGRRGPGWSTAPSPAASSPRRWSSTCSSR